MPITNRKDKKERRHRQRDKTEKTKNPRPSKDDVGKRFVELLGKTLEHVQFEKMHGVTLTVSPKATHSYKLRVCLSVLDQKLKGKGTLRDRMKLAPASELAQFNNFRRELTRFIFGTQEPELKLRMTIASLDTGVGATVDASIPLGWVDVLDRGSWAAVFDEVKLLHGAVAYWPNGTAPTNSNQYDLLGVAAIDYDDATLPGTFDALNAYDTARWCYLIIPFSGARSHVSEPVWHWRNQGIPDLQWINTTDTITICAWWKCKSKGGNGFISASIGYVERDVFVRFRQVS